MNDREPVNIMGVIAFPNPDKDKRVIRFIDSEYHTLFTVKDGEDIVVTDLAGQGDDPALYLHRRLPCEDRQLRVSHLRVCGVAGAYGKPLHAA